MLMHRVAMVLFPASFIYQPLEWLVISVMLRWSIAMRIVSMLPNLELLTFDEYG